MFFFNKLMRERLIRKKTEHVFLWLGKNIDSFRIDSNREQDFSVKDPTPWLVKPLCELLFLLLILQRHGIKHPGFQKLHDFVIETVNGFDWHALAAYDPSAATPLAMIADYFAVHGKPPPFDIDHFGRLHRTGYFNGMDRIPYREMDLVYCLSRVGIPDATNQMVRMFEKTAFGQKQSLARYSIDDMYSLTHAIFYLTDVGRREPETLLGHDVVVRIRRDLIGLTVVMLRGDNIDVLGELLLCWVFCRFTANPIESRIFDLGINRILAAVAADGSVPYNTLSEKRRAAGQATFSELYHTTLVVAMLLSITGEKK